MSGDPALEIGGSSTDGEAGDGGGGGGPASGDDGARGVVPAPLPPDDPEAWYAPDVRAQYEVTPGVVATIRERAGDGFGYRTREPGLGPDDRAALETVRDHFSAGPSPGSRVR